MTSRKSSRTPERKTLSEVYRESLKKLTDPAREEIVVRMLLSAGNGLKGMSDFYLHEDDFVKDLRAYGRRFNRYLRGEPVQYILHSVSFLGRDFHVDRRVLIPRNETEEVVLFAKEKIKETFPRGRLSIADIGTGSGVIGITLGRFFRRSDVYLSDIDPKALQVARVNIKKQSSHAKVLRGNALEPFIKKGIKLDVIVANPPYVTMRERADSSVIAHEPHGALFTPASLPVYEAIMRDADKVRRGPLLIVFECDPPLHETLVQLIKKYLPGACFEFRKDINGHERMLSVRLE